jgi:multicomponent Na+:H+ antiporter subunit G
MIAALAGVLLLLGTGFVVVAAIGLLRLPDLYTRMHAVTKAGTLGIGCILVSAAVAFGDVSVATRAVVAILFVLFTAPVSAHMIGRAGYLGNVPLWEGTAFDDWRVGYDDLQREGGGSVAEHEADAESATTAPSP